MTTTEILNDFAHGVPSCSWFDDFCLPGGGLRHPTFKAALTIAAQNMQGKINIVETGCQRMADDWGAGMSTTIFAKWLARYDAGQLRSCDINPQNVALANAVTEEYAAYRQVVTSDSVRYLKDYTEQIDILYLDSYDYPDAIIRQAKGDDWPNTPFDEAVEICGDALYSAQMHCYKELMAAEPKLVRGSLVLIDDNSLPGGGKSWLAKTYMLNKPEKYMMILDSYQSLWIVR